MSEDKLTAEERAAFKRLYKGNPDAEGRDMDCLLEALVRLAPAPKPPEPLPHELPARWREEGGFAARACADELDAALQRWRDHISSATAHHRLATLVAGHVGLPASEKTTIRAAQAVVDALLTTELAP